MIFDRKLYRELENYYYFEKIILDIIQRYKAKDTYKGVYELKNKEVLKEDKVRENKDGTKKQYINNVGVCSWADDENNLPDWFKSREYREAYVGEEDFYSFLRTWLGNLDYRDADTVLQLEWKKLMRGNLRDLTEQINGEWSTNVVALATIISKEKDGGVRYDLDFSQTTL